MRFPRRLVPAAFALIYLLTSPRLAAADTFVSGTLPTNTTWTLAQSPIVVTGHLTVPAGITLTIQPGVVVKFEPSQGLEVYGTLIARGTQNSKIYLTSAQTPVTAGSWSRISFQDSSTDAVYDGNGNWLAGSVLEHAIIEGGGLYNYLGTVQITDALPLLDSLTIRTTRGHGVFAEYYTDSPGTLRIRRSTFTGLWQTGGDTSQAPYAVYVQVRPQVVVEDNVISGWYTGIMLAPYTPFPPVSGPPREAVIARNTAFANVAGISVFQGRNLNLRVTDNIVHSNQVGASLYVPGSATVTATGNLFRHNSHRGLTVDGLSSSPNTVSLSRNIFADNVGDNTSGGHTGDGGGLDVTNMGPTTVTHNVFGSNVESWSTHSGAGAANFRIISGALTFSQNLVAGNYATLNSGVRISLETHSTATVTGNTFTQNAALESSPLDLIQPAVVKFDSSSDGNSGIEVRNNNFFGNASNLPFSRYTLHATGWNTTTNATGNWWGTTDPGIIQSLVRWIQFGTDTGAIDTSFPLTSINTNASIAPPTGLVVNRSGGTANVSWNANAEGDAAGYRVWYGVPGQPFYDGTGAAQGPSPIDVGNVTSFQLTGLPANMVVTVTAYDTQRDGVTDQTDGHESWFASLPVAPVRLLSFTADRTAPQQASSGAITFTAQATGGKGPLQYRFQVWDGSVWQYALGWGSSNTFVWSPVAPNANYRVRVWVRDFLGSEVDLPANAQSEATIDFPITPAPLVLANISASPASPQPVNSSIFFSTSATGGTTTYQYKWRLSSNGGATYSTLQDWSSSSSLLWQPTASVADARIDVWLRDSGTADAPMRQSTVSYVITAPLALTSITPNLPAPQMTGTTITFSASASGGVTPYQFKWWIYDGASWTAIQNWTTSATFAWTPATPSGAYRVGVWIRNAGSTADTSANANSNGSIGYPITAPVGALTVTGLTSNVASPQATGTAITFTASATGGTPPLQYKWRLSTNGGTSYSTLQEWNTNASLTWTPASPITDARINLWARNAGVTADSPQAQATMSYVITAAPAGALVLNSITSDAPSPQPVNATIWMTANASGGTAPYQYKWWIHNGTTWLMMQDWSTSNRFGWMSSVPGVRRVAVWVRNAGSTADTYDNAGSNGSVEFVISPPVAPLSVTSLTSNVPSPQQQGTPITFHATGTGGAWPYQFKWRLSTDGGASFTTVLDWNSNGSFTWTPAAVAADARINVWVRSFGATTDAPEAQATMPYVVNGPANAPLALNSITSNVPSPQQTGTTVTFTANASGGTAPYQYKWWLFDGSWSVVSNWSTSSTLTWTPPAASSAYRIGVWVRSAGNSNDTYENANSNDSVGYVITAGAASPLVVTSVTRSHLSPQPTGTTMTFTANATGGIPPYQYRWRMSTDGGTSFFFPTAWSDSPTFVWTPSTPFAEVRIQVMVRNFGNTTDIFDVLHGTYSYEITAPTGGPLVLNSITSNVASPQQTGTTITFTANASGGTAPYEYKWWLFDGGWNVMSNWSTSSTFTWTPIFPLNVYRIGVWVRSAGNTADTYENANANSSIGYVITSGPPPLMITSLTSTTLPPQPPGTVITFTTTADGGTAPYQFKWRLSTDGGVSFTTAQDWSANASFTWTPTAPVAVAHIQVWARNSGVTLDVPQAQRTVSYIIAFPSAGPLVLNSIVPTLSSPRTAGTSITFTASASGGTGPYQYKWWILDGSWQVVKEWSTDNTFTWTPSTPSSAYRVAVWVRNAGSSENIYDNPDSNGSIGFVILP